MLEQVLMLLEAMDSDEFIDKIAQLYKHMYDGFIKAGFTQDQAIQIVAGMKIGAS